MLISLSHLCFLFSWNSLIFHNAGNSTLFDQNSLKLSNEFQLPVYLVFQLASPPPDIPSDFQTRIKTRCFLAPPHPKHPPPTPPPLPLPHHHPPANGLLFPQTLPLSVILRPWSVGSSEADVIRQLCNPSGAQK